MIVRSRKYELFAPVSTTTPKYQTSQPQMEMVRPVLASISARGSCRAAGNLGRYLASITPGSESDP